jgi:glutathione S-transferase kappa 1
MSPATVSLYTYFALVHLERIKDKLAEHDVTIDVIPFFLGGVMQASGNQPPCKAFR